MAYRKNILLQLGAVTVPIDLDSAVVREDSLRNVCVGTSTPHSPAGVRNNTSCPECGNSDFGTFKKAKAAGREFTVVETTEVATIRAEAIGHTKDVIAISAHPIDEVRTQTLQGEGVYYLTPSKESFAGMYSWLVDTLERHPELGFCGLWTPTSRTNLYEIRIYGDTLVMEQRVRTEDIAVKQQARLAVDPVNQQQIDTLLPVMTRPFDPATYADTYKARLDELIASKVAEEGIVPDAAGKKKAATPAGTVDLTSLLAQMAAAPQLKESA